MKLVLSLLLLVPAAAAAVTTPPRHPGAAPPLATIERARFVDGVHCVALAQGRGDSAATEAAVDEALDGVVRLQDALSLSQAGSELTRLNAAAASERVACSPELYGAIDEAMQVADETGGIWDPTIEPLTRAWDVRGEGRVPAQDEIAAARVHVGWRAVAREPSTRTVRFTRPGMGLDLDAVAPGYALDRAADLLRGRGIARALFEFGGDVLAISNREPWQATVVDPRDRSTPAFRLALTNAALATAIQSDTGGVASGVRAERILDPRTGLPLRTDASATVVMRSGARALALATALLLMGRDRAAAFVAAHPDLGALWIEPASDGLHAWAWNLPAIDAETGVTVLWMTRR